MTWIAESVHWHPRKCSLQFHSLLIYGLPDRWRASNCSLLSFSSSNPVDSGREKRLGSYETVRGRASSVWTRRFSSLGAPIFI